MSTSQTPFKQPRFGGTAFNCPLCNAYANMTWYQLCARANNSYTLTSVHHAYCSHCHKSSCWLEKDSRGILVRVMLYPTCTTASLPHPDTPDTVLPDYSEAREIFNKSPRGAAALLRLAIQKLCIELGEKGKKLDDDIAALVIKGLPTEIQKSLDIVRVIGNNAVHPGEINSKDVSEIAASLFELVNYIIEDRISKPKKLKELYQRLPKGAKDAINKRDGSKAK